MPSSYGKLILQTRARWRAITDKMGRYIRLCPEQISPVGGLSLLTDCLSATSTTVLTVDRETIRLYSPSIVLSFSLFMSKSRSFFYTRSIKVALAALQRKELLVSQSSVKATLQSPVVAHGWRATLIFLRKR